MLDIFEQKFADHTPAELTSTTDGAGMAAVLIALVAHPDEPTVILTKRAEHLKSHPGQVSFPGGKYEHHDDNLLVTAYRETWEEIGLTEDAIRILAELPVKRTRFEMPVVPFLGIVEPGYSYRIDRSELDDIFEVPLSFFVDQRNIRYQQFDGPHSKINMPCYHYEGFVIWGFTLGILVDLLNDVLATGITLEYPDSLKSDFTT